MIDRERIGSLDGDAVVVWSWRRRQTLKKVDAAFIVATRDPSAGFRVGRSREKKGSGMGLLGTRLLVL